MAHLAHHRDAGENEAAVRHVLVVEVDDAMAELKRSALSRAGFEVTCVAVVTLEVQNDGIALPHDFARERACSLGLQLVTTLATQLGARLSVRREPSTSFQLSFAAQA